MVQKQTKVLASCNFENHLHEAARRRLNEEITIFNQQLSLQTNEALKVSKIGTFFFFSFSFLFWSLLVYFAMFMMVLFCFSFFRGRRG